MVRLELVPLRRVSEVHPDDVDPGFLDLAHLVEREAKVPVVVPRVPFAVREELRPLVRPVAAHHDIRGGHGDVRFGTDSNMRSHDGCNHEKLAS